MTYLDVSDGLLPHVEPDQLLFLVELLRDLGEALLQRLNQSKASISRRSANQRPVFTWPVPKTGKPTDWRQLVTASGLPTLWSSFIFIPEKSIMRPRCGHYKL